jgi:perosamine synthetase
VKIPLSKPDIGEAEISSIVEVLRSGRLSIGPKVEEFERQLAAYSGVKYAVAVNSGTSALHLAIRALGIGVHDEVITTSFSFVASTNCILYEGAHPVFIDIDPVTLNIDAAQLRHFLEERCTFDVHTGILLNKTNGRTVRAILPVHVFGLPCDMARILELAGRYNLRVIEDACEALGAEYHGGRAGSFGDAGVFAFYPNKQITTGEGGVLLTNNQTVAAECSSLRNQGRDDSSVWLSHTRLGYNYRLSELHSALGIAQLARINELLEKRQQAAATYNSGLSGVPHLLLPAEVPRLKRSWFVYVVQLDLPDPPDSKDTRNRVMLRLRELGIECQAYFPAIHRQTYFAAQAKVPARTLVHTEAAADRCLALPFFPTMTLEEISYVSETLKSVLHEETQAAKSVRSKSASVAKP